MESLSSNEIFTLLVLRSFGVTFAQAILSVFLVCLVATLLACLLEMQVVKVKTWLCSVVETVGNFAVVLPGLCIALLIVDLSASLSFVPRQGLWAIVLAHFILNVLFMTSLCQKALQAFLNGGGAEELEAAALLGAPSMKNFFYFFKGPFLKEFRTWVPILFLWCFGAFATVVILGGGPTFASPEVLLFYSLQGDFGSHRIWILVFLQMSLAWFISKKALSFGSHAEATLSHKDDHGAPSRKIVNKRLYWPRLTGPLGLFIFFFCLMPMLWLLATSLKGGPRPANFWEATRNSFYFAALVATFNVVTALKLFFASAKIRLWLVSFMGISTTVIGALWIHFGTDIYLEGRAWLQIFLSALLLAFVQVPIISLWMSNRINKLPKYLWEAPRLLGATAFETKLKIILPQCRDIIFKVAFVGAIGALGELALASLIVRDAPLLASVSQQLASQYNFSGINYILLSMLVMSVLLFAIQTIFSRKYSLT